MPDREKTTPPKVPRPVEELHRTIFREFVDGFAVSDRQGHFLEVNKTFCRMLGYSRRELLTMCVADIEAIERPRDVAQHVERLKAAGRDYFETRQRRKDGAIIDVGVSIIYLAGDGRFAAVVRDISQRKRLENELRLRGEIIDNAAEGVVMVKARDGTIVYTNLKFEKMFGNRPGELIGKPINIVNAPSAKSSAETAREIMGILRATGEWRGEILNVKKDGTRFWCYASVSTFEHSTYGIVWIGIHQDISERKKAEEVIKEANLRLKEKTKALEGSNKELKFTQKILEQSNRQLASALAEVKRAQQQLLEQERLTAVGQLARGIAHDFNNALMPIVGCTSLLLSNPQTLNDKKETLQLLKTVETAARNATATVRRMQEFCRPSSKIEHKPIDFRKLITEAVTMTMPKWKEEMQAQGVPVKIMTKVQHIPAVTGNQAQLNEVLTNLILNAIDAMPRGGTIKIIARPHSSGKWMELQVSDTGIGMAADIRRQCMDPFFTTKGGNRSGLGLAIVRGLIRQHKGIIEIRSAPGKGTAVTMRLPLAKPG
ncbi:MAG: PAS domain-containing sensor histidine kinase [Lentisphaerae bacterium]|nr:PAS domain-containing sensor histidine kinase [Lentisphaerota bacterium]